MAIRIVDFFRDAKTGVGIPGRTVSLRRSGDNVEIATAQTDAFGMFAFTLSDVAWPGPIYYMVDDGSGTYKRHSGQSFGQVGAVWFDAVQEAIGGLGKGVQDGFAVSADGSGMKVSVAAGHAIAKDGIPYYSEGAEEVTIAASDGSNPRIDLIVLRVTRKGQALQGKFELVAIAGTPASSPVAPSPLANSANDDIVLAEVLVDASASVISSGKVTDKRFSTTGQAALSVPLQGSAIDDGTLSGSKLEASAVTTAKINDGAVTNAKVGTGIDAAKIANGTVSNTEFQHLDGVTSAIQTQLNAKVDSSTHTSDLAGKSATSHTHTQLPTLSGKAINAYSSVVSIDSTGTDNICDFNLGPLVSGVTYDVIAHGTAQANAPSGQSIMAYIRIEAGGTPASGYGTATVGGERQIAAFDSKEVVGAGSTINIALRAATTGGTGSINGALVCAWAIPRNVPAS